jgi:transposase-like protein
MGDTTDPDAEVPERARGPRRYSAKYKAQILEEYERLDKAAKGALLRREGLYASLISEWRKQRDRGALQALAKRAGRQPADPRDQQVARILKVVGSDEQRSHGGRLVPNHTETVASSVLHQDIAGRKQHLRAIVNLDC